MVFLTFCSVLQCVNIFEVWLQWDIIIINGLMYEDVQLVLCLYTGECEIGGLDLVFLLDASGSIGEDNFVAMKQLVKNIASSLTIGPENTRVAVIVFESGVRLEFNLNSYTNINSLSQAIDNIFYDSGGTSTHLALQLLRESAVSELLGVRPSTDTTHIAIVITDGQSNSPTATAEEARKVHTDTDFTVFAVGIGSGIGSDELTTIASRDDYVILATSFTTQEFQRLEADIRAETCTGTCVFWLYLSINI